MKNRCARPRVAKGVAAAGAVILCVTAAIVVFFPVLFPNDTLDYLGVVDMSLYFGPNLSFYDHALHVARDFPAWNPLILCGTPYAANPQTMAFYPPNVARGLLTARPTPIRTMVSFTLLVWIHLVWIGMGAFFLSRSHGLRVSAALAAALAMSFSFTALQTAQINPVLLMTASWLPWLALCLRRAFLAAPLPAVSRWIFAGALAYAMIILSGFSPYLPAISLGIALYCAVHWGVSMARDAEGRLPQPPSLKRTAVIAAIAGLGGVLFAAVVLLPCAEFITHSTRSAGSAYLIDKRQPGLETAHHPLFVLARLVYYPPLGRGFRPLGAGVGVALLCLFAAWHRRRREAIPYACLLYLFADTAIGPPFPVATVLQRLAPFQMSNPDYLAVLCPMPVALLAAFGLDSLLDTRQDANHKRWRAVYAAAAGLAVAAGLLYAMTAPDSVYKADQMMDTGAEQPMPVTALVAAGACACAVLSMAFTRGRSAIAPLVLLCLFGEMYAASRNLVPFPRERISTFSLPEPVLRQAGEIPAFWPGNTRYGGQYWNTLMYIGKATPTGYDPLHLASTYRLLSPETARSNEDHRFIPPVLPAHSYPFLKRPFWLLAQAVAAPMPPVDRAYPCATTVFLDGSLPPDVASIDLESLPEQWVSDAFDRIPLMVRPATEGEPVPGWVSRRISVKRPEQALAVVKLQVRCEARCEVMALATDETGLFREHLGLRKLAPGDSPQDVFFPLPDWDPMELAIEIRGAAGAAELTAAELLVDRADEDRFVKVIERTPDRVRVQVDAPGNRILLFTDADYPGWEATVNGMPVPILRANDAFKAVALSAGRHEVEFRFRSRTLQTGGIVSITALAGAIAVTGALHWQGRRQRPGDSR